MMGASAAGTQVKPKDAVGNARVGDSSAASVTKPSR